VWYNNANILTPCTKLCSCCSC